MIFSETSPNLYIITLLNSNPLILAGLKTLPLFSLIISLKTGSFSIKIFSLSFSVGIIIIVSSAIYRSSLVIFSSIINLHGFIALSYCHQS